jgi:alpha-amylase/alpha-mannosidase (GH57 family)
MSGEYKLPWTRMHALKDYYGMVEVLKDFPEVHQTFNLVPSMMVQIEEYASGKAIDPFLIRALTPAENLTEDDQHFILQYFFQANEARLINRFPRYRELHEAWRASDRNVSRIRWLFGTQAFRDLQVLSQLAWFDEEFLEHDPEVRALVEKEREYTVDDQALVGRKELEICGLVLPTYRKFAASGQVEISTTPFYHPILPLLCDSNIAEVSHPYVPLPPQFRYPQDARKQLELAREYMRTMNGAPPKGLWPSEGSVSDEVLAIAADLGFRWIATDNGVLSRTVNRAAEPLVNYRPYLWRQNGREIRAIFRDHFLSDLIGFVYSRMGAVEAAEHFLARIRENCQPVLAAGQDAMVPIILDGENAWEYYDQNGRPFLRELYGRIARASDMQALTVSEALDRMAPEVIDHIFPASWISTNFDIWIGAEEDNKAWDYLLRARQLYDRVLASPQAPGALTAGRLQLAEQELLIAEGSDWCWWYGPEHESANGPEFDQLFRQHLANVYRALNMAPPDELSRAIVKTVATEFHQPPSGPIRPTIEGEVSSYFEWLGAGAYRLDKRSGAMHGQRFLTRELFYGTDGKNLFLRLDFELADESLAGTELRVNLESTADKAASSAIVARLDRSVELTAVHMALGESPLQPVEAAFVHVLEMRISLAAAGIQTGQALRFQLSLWRDGLPMDALPQQGWIEFSTAEQIDWPI